MAGLFLFTYLFWYYASNPELSSHLKDINQGVFYGLLALIGIRPRGSTAAPVNIDTVTTEGGDINAPGEPGKGKQNAESEILPVGP